MKAIGLLSATALALVGCSNPIAAPFGGVVTVECAQARGTGWATDVVDTDGWHSYVVTSYAVVEACMQGEPGAVTDPDILLRNHIRTVTVRSGSDRLEGHIWSWDPPNDLAAILLREELENLADGSPPHVGDEVSVQRNPDGASETTARGTLTRADREALVPTIALSRADLGKPVLDDEGGVVGIVVVEEERNRVFVAPLPLLCHQLLDCSDIPSARWPDWP